MKLNNKTKSIAYETPQCNYYPIEVGGVLCSSPTGGNEGYDPEEDNYPWMN